MPAAKKKAVNQASQETVTSLSSRLEFAGYSAVPSQSELPTENTPSEAYEKFFNNLVLQDGCFLYMGQEPLVAAGSIRLYSKGDVIRKLELREEIARAFNILLPQEVIDQKLKLIEE